MRKQFRLTRGQPSQSMSMDFDATAVVVVNPTPSPIYLRFGAPDFPTESSADMIVPAASNVSFPVAAREFAAIFADTSSLANNNTGLTGLFTAANITFLDRSEQVPAFGTSNFASLSLSNGFRFQAVTPGYLGNSFFDLNAWGGLMLLVIADATSGQGIAQIEVTDDNPLSATPPTWKIYAQYAFWPNIALAVNIPRTTRYMRILVNGAGIAGDAAMTARAGARYSMTEISSLSATQSTQSYTKAVAVPSLGQQDFIYCTVGLEALTARLNVTAGNNGQLAWYVASSPAGPWALLAYREQNVQSFYNSITRTVGQLDAYLKLSILDTGLGGITGSLNISIQKETDTSGYLQNIFAATGDKGDNINVLQDNYHALLSINGWLTTLDGRVDGLESLITATNTKLDTLIAQANAGIAVLAINPTVPIAGAWHNAGAVFTPGWYIISVMLGYQIQAAMNDSFFIQLALGTGATPVVAFYGTTAIQPETGVAPFTLTGPKAGGFIIGAGMTNLWVYAGNAPTFVSLNIGVRAP